MDILKVQACSYPINIADSIVKKICNNLPIEIHIIGRNSSEQAVTSLALARGLFKHGMDFTEFDYIEVEYDGKLTNVIKFVVGKR